MFIVRALPQIHIQTGLNSATDGGVRSERSAADRNDGNFGCGHQPTKLPVEVPAGKILIKRKFGMDVRRKVGYRILVGSISLRAKCGVEGEGKDRFALAYKLIRVLDGCRPLPIVVKVISGPELGGASVVHADMGLRIFTESGEDIARIGRETNSVGRLQAPGLPTQKFPFAPLQVQPVETETIGVRIGSNENVGSVVAVEVELHVTGDIVLAEFGVGLDIEPGILSGGAIFREMPLHRIAERNGPEVGRGHETGVGAAEDVFEVHETAGGKVSRADAERQRRLFWLVLQRTRGHVHRTISVQRSIDQTSCIR